MLFLVARDWRNIRDDCKNGSEFGRGAARRTLLDGRLNIREPNSRQNKLPVEGARGELDEQFAGGGEEDFGTVVVDEDAGFPAFDAGVRWQQSQSEARCQ